MNDLTSVGIIVIVMLIQAFLQLTPSVFSLWYHYALAKNSRNKVLDMSGYFVSGVEVAATLMIVTIYFMMLNMPISNVNWIFAGIFTALGVFVFWKYYRKGDGTELFISRKKAKSFYEKTRTVRKKSDIFMLGVVSYTSEFLLVLPLTAVLILQMVNFEVRFQIIILVAYLFLTILPTTIMRWNFLYGKNLADIQRARVKNKKFYKLLIGCSCILIVFLLILAEVW